MLGALTAIALCAAPAADAGVTGSLDPQIVRDVVHQNARQIRECYEETLIAHPSLQGKVVIRWVVAIDGSVEKSEVSVDEMADASMAAYPVVAECLASHIRHWTFPKPLGGGNVVVSFPFLFKTNPPPSGGAKGV